MGGEENPRFFTSVANKFIIIVFAKSPAVGRQVASKQQTKMIVESLEREFIVKATPIIKKVALNPKTDFRRGFARSK